MTKSKNTKQRKAELLGMPVGTAEKHLRKSVIHELARQLGKNLCCRCGSEIAEPDELALVHVQGWEESPAQFWDLNNVAFSHASCQAERSGKRQGEKKQMSNIEIRVEDPNGNALPGTRHGGQLYVAGKGRERYQVRIKNKTGARVLVVVTVDGRNVITGKPGDHHDAGHVLAPHQSFTFKGWRTSDEEVAAFEFGSKSGSYSAQMGSPENVGVIGVAVFDEEKPDPKIVTVKETTYIPYPVPNPFLIQPYQPSVPSWMQTVGTSTSDSAGIAPMGGMSWGAPLSSGDVSVVNCSNTSTSSTLNVDTARSRSASRGIKGVEVAQSLGTGWGEAVTSQVRSVEFKRATEDPCEVFVIRYDSLRSLKRQGILVRPSEKRQETPQAFPESSGYCEPPPGGLRRDGNPQRYK